MPGKDADGILMPAAGAALMQGFMSIPLQLSVLSAFALKQSEHHILLAHHPPSPLPSLMKFPAQRAQVFAAGTPGSLL
jgi:hypothetical protein